MKRKKRIKELENKIEGNERTRQELQNKLDKLKDLEDLKMSVLWKALEKSNDAGYASTSFSILLTKQAGGDNIDCVITTKYHVENNQREIIILFFKEKFESTITLKITK